MITGCESVNKNLNVQITSDSNKIGSTGEFYCDNEFEINPNLLKHKDFDTKCEANGLWKNSENIFCWRGDNLI